MLILPHLLFLQPQRPQKTKPRRLRAANLPWLNRNAIQISTLACSARLSARAGSLLAAALASGQKHREGRERLCVCEHPPQPMSGKGAGRDCVGKAGAYILNYQCHSGWISAGWMAIYCWHRPAINHYLSGAMRKLQGWLSHPPSWRHSRSGALYIPWLLGCACGPKTAFKPNPAVIIQSWNALFTLSNNSCMFLTLLRVTSA